MKIVYFIIPMICLAITALVGWIANIVKLIEMDCGMCSLQCLRIVGIFVSPLGTVLGFVSN